MTLENCTFTVTTGKKSALQCATDNVLVAKKVFYRLRGAKRLILNIHNNETGDAFRMYCLYPDDELNRQLEMDIEAWDAKKSN